jgi:hypothetical protein
VQTSKLTYVASQPSTHTTENRPSSKEICLCGSTVWQRTASLHVEEDPLNIHLLETPRTQRKADFLRCVQSCCRGIQHRHSDAENAKQTLTIKRVNQYTDCIENTQRHTPVWNGRCIAWIIGAICPTGTVYYKKHRCIICLLLFALLRTLHGRWESRIWRTICSLSNGA